MGPHSCRVLRGSLTGGSTQNRVTQDADGTLFTVAMNRQRMVDAAHPLPSDQVASVLAVYASTDDGKSFALRGNLSQWSSEGEVKSLGARMVATVRYQTQHWVDTRYDNGTTLSNVTQPGFKNTAVLYSGDRGATWSRPKLVTGYDQQTACLVVLAPNTLVLPFGHKDDGEGQRFIVSYDGGRSFSNTIFQLHQGGLYASSVATNNGTIVTAFSCELGDPQSACAKNESSELQFLRWTAPMHDDPAHTGFFVPGDAPMYQY